MATDFTRTNRKKANPAGRISRPVGAALAIAGVYFAIGCVWVLFSETERNAGMVGDLLYGFATSAALFWVVCKVLRKEAVRSEQLELRCGLQQEEIGSLADGKDTLTASERQYGQLFAAMPYGCCLFEITRDSNGAAVGIRTLMATPAYDLIAKPLSSEPQEEAFLRILPGERSAWLADFAKVVESGETNRYRIRGEAEKVLELVVFRVTPGRFAASIHDVTECDRANRERNAEAERLKVTLNSIGDGVAAVDSQGRITMLNGAAEQLTGMRREQAVGLPIDRLLELCAGDSGSRFVSEVKAGLSRNPAAVIDGKLQVKTAGGAERLIACSAARIAGGDGEPLGYVAVFRDATEQETKEAEILYLSYHDTLTGLYNRTFFEEELKRLNTERQLPLSIIMGDANNLKLVNDVFGHKEGDEMLCSLAQILKDSCRTEDIISRWGGDEFTILLPQTDYNIAEMICRRIKEKCREQYTIDRNLSPSISLGFETKVSAETDINVVIKTAEDRMYQNKLLENRAAHDAFLNAMRHRINRINLESEEHAGRLAELCERTGREMNLRGNELADLRILSVLHDIGQAAIDARIFEKPSSLTAEEWEEVKRHSGIGYRIVRSTPELVLVADYILGHHERWDGKGYPQGLKGMDIPLPARIFAVVDAFDAMTQGRPYRQALNQETALFELYRNAGTQFDPEVVNAFASVLNTLTD